MFFCLDLWMSLFFPLSLNPNSTDSSELFPLSSVSYEWDYLCPSVAMHCSVLPIHISVRSSCTWFMAVSQVLPFSGLYLFKTIALWDDMTFQPRGKIYDRIWRQFSQLLLIIQLWQCFPCFVPGHEIRSSNISPSCDISGTISRKNPVLAHAIWCLYRTRTLF